MAQLDFYALAKRYYAKGFYSYEDVGVFVQAKKITPEQYKEITNLDYVEQQ
ncbi:XkdX family protein [Bacillus thuringiensis]|nr:XkdX family protein [Bacillus thuringiensis]